MTPFDLPAACPLDSPLARQLAVLVEWLTRQDCTYTVLAGEFDALDYSLVATKRFGHPQQSIRASIARSQHELEKARTLVRQRYASRGYLTSPSGAYRTYEDRWMLTLIAEAGNMAVGTMSVRLDGPRGLLADDIYSKELNAIRSAGRRICEFGGLALAEQTDTRTVLTTLFGLAYGVGKVTHDEVTDVLIEVNPQHVGFYRRVFGFVVGGGERLCERVQAPAVLLRTSVDELEARLRAYCNAAACGVTASPASQWVFA
jgi:N-acyl amino acid synthase FeeM